MIFLNDKDTVQKFSDLIIRVEGTIDTYGRHLIFNPKLTEGQKRVGCATPDKTSVLAFSHQLLAWFTGNAARMLWVSHIEDNFPSYSEVFNAARLGFGAKNSIFESPGHMFESANFHEFDLENLDALDVKSVSCACGIISIIQHAGWNGWLITEGCCDRIEFWEGNVYFHSATDTKINDALAIMERFQCLQVM